MASEPGLAAGLGRRLDDAHLLNAAIEIHHDDPEFGYRFIADELTARGITAGRNRVNRLCSLQRLWSVHSRKRGLNRKPGPPVHDDLVERRFTAPELNQLWLTGEGCLLRADRRLLDGRSDDRRPGRQRAAQRCGPPPRRRPPAAAPRHGGPLRPRQSRSHAYRRALTAHGLRGSMGRVATCADNAAMESFFALLQKNVLNRRRWTTREELRLAIIIWIEKTYHRRRRQDRLGRLTPIEFETLQPAAHAA